MMIGTLWTIMLPALLGLQPLWSGRRGRALAVAILGLALVSAGPPL